jgi:hypothetical protein
VRLGGRGGGVLHWLAQQTSDSPGRFAQQPDGRASEHRHTHRSGPHHLSTRLEPSPSPVFRPPSPHFCHPPACIGVVAEPPPGTMASPPNTDIGLVAKCAVSSRHTRRRACRLCAGEGARSRRDRGGTTQWSAKAQHGGPCRASPPQPSAAACTAPWAAAVAALEAPPLATRGHSSARAGGG